jgi:DNA-binding IclR family transcriptional regulator
MATGRNAVGAPIFNHESKPVAAVVVIGPVRRIRGEGNSDVVIRAKRAAAEISKSLHYDEASTISK